MKRRLFGAALAGCLALSIAPAAHASQPLPAHSSARGRSHVAWAKAWSQWALGDASNPLIASVVDGDCGDLVGRVFFMAAPIDVGLEFDCEIPTGVWIVFSQAGFFDFVDPGSSRSDAELNAGAAAGFAAVDPGSNILTLDGRSLTRVVTDTGAFDIDAEAGSFYADTLGLPVGTVRTAISGNWVVLHPLRPGDHEVVGAVSFDGGAGGVFEATYHLHVG